MNLQEYPNALLGGLGFETIIPVAGAGRYYHAFLRRGEMYPVIGGLIGVVTGGLAVIFSLFPTWIGAAVTLGSWYAITGINHVDGLVDTFDGLATTGDASRKLEAVKDGQVGAGGLTALVLVLLLLYGGVVELSSMELPRQIFWGIVAAEVVSKQAVLTAMALARISHPGMGQRFIQQVSGSNFLKGLLVTLILTIGSTGCIGVGMVGVTLLVSYILVRRGEQIIGGVNGDLLGAVHEIAKPLALIVFVVLSHP